ncbi:DUF4153 domain-containing protein [Falsibacillus albus]|uniref:DUF4173 domain-containing protein n=1 Tax=Falsibacillus albus TaxID=2478915 RepID=A0A3L7JXL7_9BACI|nr:DUF4173 domain-containing protein [Falsibacillus albus]RLQ95537.1 DUF4173 domain-containing protein [Falsibacillus albus]
MTEHVIMKSKMAIAASLLMGVLYEIAFFHGKIGISYLLFVSVFYLVFFTLNRKKLFTHKRMGMLILFCIWCLSLGYFLYTNPVFYGLNLLLIPALMISHIVLISRESRIEWQHWSFIGVVIGKIFGSIAFSACSVRKLSQYMKSNVHHRSYKVLAKIIAGLLISIPILVLVTTLLSSADEKFSEIIKMMPNTFGDFNIVEYGFRTVIAFGFAFILFGFLHVIHQKSSLEQLSAKTDNMFSIDAIISLIVLFSINGMYLLFIFVQFKYFFSGTLQSDYTYAEYARRGFFELVFVTIVNLTLLNTILSFTVYRKSLLKYLLKGLLSLLVVSSGIILCSAFLRLSLYEDAYGYTFLRMAVHAFMVFLFIVFAYTLTRVWIDRLSLMRFYIITGLLFYSIMNMINIESIVVSKNIERFESTGKIDLQYLSQTDEGIEAMIQLYQKSPNDPQLKKILSEKKQAVINSEQPWQSYNIQSERTKKQLTSLRLK